MSITSPECLYDALPLAIRQARARAMEHPTLFGQGRILSLVQTLISFTNLDQLRAPLLFNRKKPASILGVSTRTIDRFLGQLEKLGWLKRLKQPRLKEGVWGVTSILWKSWVLESIFILPKGMDKWGNPMRSKGASTPLNPAGDSTKTIVKVDSKGVEQDLGVVQDSKLSESKANEGLNAEDLSLSRATEMAHLSLSSKEEVLRNKLEENFSKKEKQPTFDPFGEQKKRSRRLPEDLVDPMQTYELTPAQICWLMKRCKKNSHRLQDLFAVAEPTFKKKNLKAKSALRYLVYLSGLEQDFSSRAQEVTKKEVQKKKSSRKDKWIEAMTEKGLSLGALLPSGWVVEEVINGMAFLENSLGEKRASPAIPLMENLIRFYPHWARKLYRTQETPSLSSSFEVEPEVFAISKLPDLDSKTKNEFIEIKSLSVYKKNSIEAQSKKEQVEKSNLKDTALAALKNIKSILRFPSFSNNF